MTPGPIEKLKPYFKPRPRTRPAPQQAVPAPGAAPVQQSVVAPPPTPAAAALPAAAAPAQPAPAAVPQPAPAAADGASALAARREQLAARYADLQSDLGGLVYEMAIRDSFRLDVVTRKAAELQAVDGELSSVEAQMGIAPPPVPPCRSCGAAVQAGAQYCARCGSAVGRPPISAGGAT